MILGYFGCINLTWIYTAWLPGYLEIERHMSVKFTGFAPAVPFPFGVVGGVIGLASAASYLFIVDSRSPRWIWTRCRPRERAPSSSNDSAGIGAPPGRAI